MMTISSISSLSDEEVVLLAQNGNSLAEEEIINRYKSYVGYCSSKYYMSGMEKDDIFQEGMIGLYNAIKDYNHPQKSFKNFAILCISRKIISLLKASNRQKHIPLNTSLSLDVITFDDKYNKMVENLISHDDHNPESIYINNETLNLYEKKINEVLSELELKVFECYISGMSYLDISEYLNINKKAVDNAIQRIKKKLEAALI
ncbi:MAG: sigma-70 family RNA polymerase sigma factor [Clostridia bacterium]|nr:sigma-70 family RNA polymerase sigma factor [Clostridia bacterium]